MPALFREKRPVIPNAAAGMPKTRSAGVFDARALKPFEL